MDSIIDSEQLATALAAELAHESEVDLESARDSSELALAPSRPRPLSDLETVELTPGEVQVLGPFEVPGLSPRSLRLYLPKLWTPEVPRFALYMFDGQNLFGDEPSYAGGWHLHEAIERLGHGKRLAPVVVAIDHGNKERLAELSPFAIDDKTPGQLDVLLDWIVGALRPTLERRLALFEGPVGAAVGGSSMGGLAALYAHFARPEEFGGALAMSPSLHVGRNAIFAWLAAQPTPPLSRVYLDCGVREGRGMLLPLAARVAAQLTARGYDTDRLRFRADPRGTHSEKCWRRRTPSALRFLYR